MIVGHADITAIAADMAAIAAIAETAGRIAAGRLKAVDNRDAAGRSKTPADRGNKAAMADRSRMGNRRNKPVRSQPHSNRRAATRRTLAARSGANRKACSPNAIIEFADLTRAKSKRRPVKKTAFCFCLLL